MLSKDIVEATNGNAIHGNAFEMSNTNDMN